MKNSKFNLLLAAITSVVLVSSCDKVKDKAKVDITFDLNLPSAKLYVDTISAFGNVTLDSTVIQSTLQKSMDDNNVTFADIESVKLNSAEVEMVNPGMQNFNIINKAYALMSATGLPETQVAFIDPVPSNVTKLSLSSDGADLVNYLKQNSFTFKLSALTTGPNTERDTLNVKLNFTVTALVEAPL